MSVDERTAPRPLIWWLDDPRIVRTFRYAIGSTLAVALAMGIDWRLSYIAPVLAISFLGNPTFRPTLKVGVGFVGVVGIASGVGLTFSVLLLPYPVVFLLLEGLMLFLLFFAVARGAQALVTAMLLIALTVIPVVALQDMQAAVSVAKGLVVGAGAAFMVVWLAHALVPDASAGASPPTAGQEAGEPGGAPETPIPSRQEAARSAWLSTVVVYPVVVLYFVFGLTSVVGLVFIGLLSMQPDFSAGLKAGKALIVGNVAGGLAAIVAYELLVMVPQFGFLLLLTLVAGLFFGGKLFSGAPAGPLFGMAFSTLLLVIGSTTSMYGEADAKAWERAVQITAAVVYLVVAFGLILRLANNKETAHASE